MDVLFELSLHPARARSGEVSAALYKQLRQAILDGLLKPGARLPPTRMAQRVFRVSRNTAADVYERLSHEGLVSARHGSGTYVAQPIPRGAARSERVPPPSQDPRLNEAWRNPDLIDALGFWRETRSGETRAAAPAPGQEIDLRPGLVDPRAFPFATFRAAMGRELRRMERGPLAFRSAQGNAGNRGLRQAISEHVALTRAVAASADEVVVTSGAQQAFDLIARILVRAGETTVAFEDPGYPPLRAAFAAAGARLVAAPVDAEGLIVDAIPPEADIVCVCPSHQFPLGMSMSARRRRDLLELARRRGLIIVEDDYDGEFRHDGSSIEALRTAAAAEMVFYVGTFSKTMLPALRLGFVVPPPWALPTLICAKNCLDWHCSTPLQLAVASMIRDGHLARHVRRMRRLYRERRDALASALRDETSGRLEVVASAYGLHVAALATAAEDCEAASRQLAARGVRIHALDRYYLGPVRQTGFVFGLGVASPDELRQAVGALGAALASPGAPSPAP